MAKATIDTGVASQSVHTRTTADTAESQVAVIGIDGSDSVVPADATAGLKVDLGADNDITGTVTANLGATDNAVLDAIQAAVEIIDNFIAGSEGQVDVITVPAPLSTTGGGTQATALRVTVASDSTGVLSVDDNAGSLTVDGTVTANLSATDNAVLDAIQAAVEIIDNAIAGTEMQVDVLSVIPGTGATNLGKAIDSASGATDTGVGMLAIRDDALSALTPIEGDYVPLRVGSTGALHVTGGGGGTEYDVNSVAPADPTGSTFVMERDDALAALSEIEGDWTNARANANGALWVKHDGVISVDDNAGSLTIDGTVTANLSATDNAVLDAIEVDTTTIAGAVSGTEMQVDVVAALPAGTNAIGKLAANSGVDIGDVDILSIAAGSNTIGAVTPLPLASGGCSIFRSLDLDETEEEAKATAGTLYGWYIANLATTTRFLKFYNATAANVTVGTTTPVLTIPIPGNATDDIGANMLGGVGIKFDTAITVAATTGVADADTGAPGANEVVVNIFYL